MKRSNKTSLLQIRVTPQEKAAIVRQARKTNMGISEWLLSKALPSQQVAIHELLNQLRNNSDPKFVLAEIHDMLNVATADEFELIVAEAPPASLSPYLLNYVAAMVEYTAAQKDRHAPLWTQKIIPLDRPVLGTDLESLRLHLLTHSPPPFRRRNIFIDSTIGARV